MEEMSEEQRISPYSIRELVSHINASKMQFMRVRVIHEII